LQRENAERKLAEDQLRRSEDYLAEAQRLGQAGSFGRDITTGKIYWSEETFRIFQYDLGTTVTLDHILQRVHPEDMAFVKQFIEDAKSGEQEYRLLMPDGSVKHIHVVKALRDQFGRTEIVGTVIDVTQRKRAEEALQQAQMELVHVNRVTTMGELTASLAHEVNQPLGAAVTNAESCLSWLARDPPNLDEARAAASSIVKDGMFAAEIINRIRLLFKKGMLQTQVVDVNEIIRETVVILRGEATRHVISVQTEPGADLPQVIGDRVQLQQVMMNLIINGIDAMKDVDGMHELVIKSTRAEGEKVMVTVSDSGVGLPPVRVDEIFKAFFTTKPDGTGMGLSISRSIVEAHGGRLWATDNCPHGASFHFILPGAVKAPS
jgi:PAS domain S-box-containing protein